MVKNLVIVESPAKAKTITKFLDKDFVVKASMGHIMDLPKKELGVDVEKDFEPTYIVSEEKKKVVKELKTLAKGCEKIWLATDEDREGEAISWHIQKALGIKDNEYERIVFHEITKNAITKAIESPRKINMDLVNAQQARRVIDRLVGYKLSPLLWKKIRKGLSAGRVQSVAVRFIVEKEEEIQKFQTQEQWKIKGMGFHSKKNIPNILVKIANKKANLTKIDEVKEVLSEVCPNFSIKEDINEKNNLKELQVKDISNIFFKVSDVKKTLNKRSPSVPFTTSTLQQEAHRKFGFPVAMTMKLAQQLYEGIDLGNDRIALITYMRTDSLNISNESLEQITDFIKNNYGKDYSLSKHRIFKTKAKGAQEAHEAIRPINILVTPDSLQNKNIDKKLLNLYSLIWKRTVATQMPEAQIENTTISMSLPDTNKYIFESVGKIIKFDGFMKLYIEDTDEEKEDEDDNILPDIKVNDLLPIVSLSAFQSFTKPPARYTEASLVKKLESEGIGRPSTYAPTIATIITRGYIEKDKKYLFPTDIAFIVTNFLKEYFQDVISYKFTATIEESFDDIAIGNKQWVSIVADFYSPFEEKMLFSNKNAKKHIEETDKICPKCGKNLLIRLSKYGKFYSCSNYPECKYTENIDGETNNEDPTSQKEELETGDICPTCGKPMIHKKGRFGQFIACSDYPTCKTTKTERKIVKEKGCPNDAGDILEKKTRKGKIFYGCSNYPKCKFAVWKLEDLDK
jgi:DNA topoisomerase I